MGQDSQGPRESHSILVELFGLHADVLVKSVAKDPQQRTERVETFLPADLVEAGVAVDQS